MKNVLMKFAGFFVEKVPIEESLPPRPSASSSPGGSSAAHTPVHQAPPPQALHGHFPSASGTTAMPGPRQDPVTPVAVALRAWVPQEYAGYLTPYGVHVIAAGGELTPEQARAYGAQVLIVSSECLGSHTHLLSHPQMPTVFITPQQMMIPPRAGVVQTLEPLRASEVAMAAREALDSWASA